ncbi:MAG: hypothetical protein ACHQNE_00960 [Candidatus Kapaibacterium sp.]
MNYWLDLFTGTTWDEFIRSGSRISGFRPSQSKMVQKIKPGDVLLCYLTGVSRWVGALRVIKQSTDKSKIWSSEDFPARLEVEPLITLDAQYGLLMDDLEGKVSFFEGPKQKGKYKGVVRASPRKLDVGDDGKTIFSLLEKANKNRISRPFDPKKLAYKPHYLVKPKKGQKAIEVTIPEPEELPKQELKLIEAAEKAQTTQHTEIQYHLLKLGSDMGFDVWVARNDRSRTWKGQILGQLPKMVTELPTQFNEATNKTIELIDVLWLKGNSIVAAFEVESTTSVYSGLLRMSDLLALQPNLEIKLYLLAPDDKSERVQQQIMRPTFALREKPIPEVCGFIPFGPFLERIKQINQMKLASSLKPEFLDTLAQYFPADEQ